MSGDIIIPPSPAPDWADPWRHPEYFYGVRRKRVFAYVLDLAFVLLISAVVWWIGAIFTVLSLGLLTAVHVLAVALVPLTYHTLTIAGERSATFGMRIVGLKVLSMVENGPGNHRPTLLQAFIQTLVFYGSVAATGSVILLISLFNSRRRTFHDWLAGMVIVNNRPFNG